ncbi:MAG: M20/M25/M40 family metallo-hydrolase, partial [Actinomycetota bacterium]|nr:M20/M25/M40 family metallo-hydrolase [Actinomycetota bacterium]
MDLQPEAVELLQRLIRFDTVNPPGAEREAIEFLRGYLEEAGLECEVLARDDERPNLVARLRGESSGPTLGFLSHVDTVLATPEEWSHDPWSGDLADGCVWGRGALDMKSQTAAEVVAAATLARAGWRPPRGELLVMAVADEEAGGKHGARFLTEEHPDRVRCDYLVNEGGGAAFEWEGRRHYGVCCAEKGVFRFRITTDGVAGHASIPRMGDNALLKMAPLLERLSERQPGYDVGEEPRALFRQLLDEELDGDPRPAVERLRDTDPLLALLFEPTLGVSVTPTRIRASEKINVIPSRAELDVDCRVPPGLGEEEALARVREVLGPDGYRLEFLERVVGNRSPFDSPLVDAFRDWLAEEDPGAELAPMMLPGFTDSRWFRAAFPDCLAYGFFPQRHMSLHQSAPLIHG